MSKLMSKLLKSTKLDGAAIMAESKILGEKDSTPTSIPALNIALSGDVDGGLRSGILTIAGN